MKICFLCDPLDNQNAGVHYYTKNLIRTLLKLDSKNQYFFIHLKENSFFDGLKNYIIPRKKIPGYASYRKFFLIPKLLKQLQPDLVIETMHIGPFRTPKKTKRAVIIHDLTPILFPKFHIKRSTLIHKLLLKKVIKKANLIICPSNNTKTDILTYQTTKAKISVIPPGIPKPKKSKLPPLYASPYILYLGTIEPRKNIETLLQAFIELKKEKNIPHRLILAGEIGWKSKKNLKKAKHKHIYIHGYANQNEKVSLLQNANLFIYPSIYEGFGIPPMEAISYGIPTICSTGGSLREIYSNKCMTFDPKDKKTLKKLILNPQPNKYQAHQVIEDFSWERSTKHLLISL